MLIVVRFVLLFYSNESLFSVRVVSLLIRVTFDVIVHRYQTRRILIDRARHV